MTSTPSPLPPQPATPTGNPSRRQCLALVPGAIAAGWLGLRSAPALAAGRETAPEAGQAARGGADTDPSPLSAAALAALPSQDPALVLEMVGASHGRKERVLELLKEAPQLAKAAVDWGFGDWETALGAASHTGNRAIAQILIEHGARPDVFTFAMLGKLEVVKAMVEAQPGVQRILGPHGITLLAHAKAGGAESATTAEYLAGLGDADNVLKGVPLPDEVKAAALGTYAFGDGAGERFEISEKNGALWIKRGERAARGLTYMGENAFAPAGAPDVRIAFSIVNNTGKKLIATAPRSVVEAARMEW